MFGMSYFLSFCGITGCARLKWTKLNSYFRQEAIHGVRNVICACSLGMEICVFTFGMDFELRGWPPQPPTFSSISTKITKKCTISNLNFDMLEAVVAILQV